MTNRYLLTMTVEHHANREAELDDYGFLPSLKVPLIRLVKATKDFSLREAKDAVEADLSLDSARGIVSLRLLCDDAEMGRSLVFVWNQMQDTQRRVDMSVDSIDTFRGGFIA